MELQLIVYYSHIHALLSNIDNDKNYNLLTNDIQDIQDVSYQLKIIDKSDFKHLYQASLSWAHTAQ